MNKRINLILAATLLGGVMTMLPTKWKAAIFISTIVALFMRYDFYEYDLRNNVLKNEWKLKK
ncbi:hypothetical protein ACFFH2_08415 [Enterococcus devriesei]|uniref:hypothetical protein n=1 Tax=Enterococcus devriesei TaxID=319970 RepID=UPI0009003806|nr:hypothetical protein [Enterococcus devriesei]